MKPWTQDLANKIAIRVKNKLDISELVKDVNIKGQDLSRAIIKDLHIISQDITNTSFFQAQLGEEGKITSFINSNLQDCNFGRTKFLGRVLMHNCDARRTNFRNAFFPDAEYKMTDFRGATFCHCVMKIGTEEGAGCKFDLQFFRDLTKMWKVKVNVTEE